MTCPIGICLFGWSISITKKLVESVFADRNIKESLRLNLFAFAFESKKLPTKDFL